MENTMLWYKRTNEWMNEWMEEMRKRCKERKTFIFINWVLLTLKLEIKINKL